MILTQTESYCFGSGPEGSHPITSSWRNGMKHIPGAFLPFCQGGKLGFKVVLLVGLMGRMLHWLLLLRIIHHLVAAKNHLF